MSTEHKPNIEVAHAENECQNGYAASGGELLHHLI